MSSYTITIELPYHISDIIDQLVIAFPDVDFKDWHYDDEPCTLIGYEDGDYPPNDFFKCDKFYVEIDSRHYVRFEFDQTVYIDNDEYKCDYFATRLKHFFPSEFYHNQFTICDQYGYERPSQQNDYYSDDDQLDDYPASLDDEHTDNSASLDYHNNNNNQHNDDQDNELLYLFMDHIMDENRIADNEYKLFKNHLSKINKNKLANSVSSK
jgi:hypothetical protein